VTDPVLLLVKIYFECTRKLFPMHSKYFYSALKKYRVSYADAVIRFMFVVGAAYIYSDSNNKRESPTKYLNEQTIITIWNRNPSLCLLGAPCFYFTCSVVMCEEIEKIKTDYLENSKKVCTFVRKIVKQKNNNVKY
jgi:hypothetical protein